MSEFSHVINKNHNSIESSTEHSVSHGFRHKSFVFTLEIFKMQKTCRCWFTWGGSKIMGFVMFLNQFCFLHILSLNIVPFYLPGYGNSYVCNC